MSAPGPIQKTLLLPGNRDSLSRIRWILSSLAHDLGFNEEEQDHIIVAVDEACANILEHAYATVKSPPPLEIQLDADEETLTVTVIDAGCPFDFASYKMPSFPQHYIDGNERGAGIYLIHQCMDQVDYDRLPDDRNRIQMMKRRNSSNATQIILPDR